VHISLRSSPFLLKFSSHKIQFNNERHFERWILLLPGE
jgi:hypothetical protein